MFKKRSDGKYITLPDPFFRIIPHVMSTRCESQVFYQHEFDVAPLTEYIKLKRQDNIDISFLSLFIACYVRTIKEHPYLNRFIASRRIYLRNNIEIVFMIKKRLDFESDEMAVKMSFDGSENIFQINEKVKVEIENSIKNSSDNETDALAKIFNKLPNFLIKAAVGLCKYADNHNFLPKSIISASPFHSSMYITYLKSIKLDRVYHHLYNFGTCSIFAGIGKANSKSHGKTISVGYTIDERICDGFSLSKAFKTVENILKNPAVLEQ